MNWKAFLKTIAHAAIGGAATAAAAMGATASLKVTLMTAAAGAVTSVISLFAKSPAQAQ